MRIGRIFISLMSLTCVSVFAAEAPDYLCTVKQVKPIFSDELDMFSGKEFIGTSFRVDRSTGVMSGRLQNAFTSTPIVIDQGDQDNGMKVITGMTKAESIGPGTTASLLYVQEFIDSPDKPFYFLHTSTESIFVGTCNHDQRM